MFKHLQRMLLIAALCLPWVTQAQVSLPYSTGFENADTAGWTFVNNATNYWSVGGATYSTGTNAIYISNNSGTSNAYTNSTTQFSYAYVDFTVASAGQFAVSFDWMANGEGNYDYLRAWIAPTTATLTAGYAPDGSTSAYNYRELTPAGWIDLGGKMNLQTSWQSVVAMPNLTAGDHRLIFMWANDGSGGSQPPAAIDNVSITELSCPRPALVQIEELLYDQALVTWTYGGNESQWAIYLGDSLIDDNVTDTFYLFNNLTALTNYTVRVRSICGTGDTSLAYPVQFTTPCTQTALPYIENFDNATTGVLPACWLYTMLNSSYSSSTYLPKVSTSNYNSAPKCLYLYGVAYTVLPPFEAPVDSLQITFSRYTTSTSYGLQVGALEADGTFVPLATFESDPTSSHVDHTVYLNNYTGNSHTIAFYNYYINSSTGYSYNYIDDIYVDYLPTCSPVTHIEASATVGAAVVSWEAGLVGEYTGAYVEYKNDTASEWLSLTTQGLSVVITDLDPASSYSVRVKSLCEGDDTARIWANTSFVTGDFTCLELDPSTADTVLFSNSTSGQSGCLAYSSWGNTAYQAIWTAAELTAAGLSAGPIIGIDLGFTASSSYAKEFSIYIGSTNTSSISNATMEVPSNMINVYGPAAHPINTSGWQHYDFAEPFSWDGSSNIIITTFMNQPTGSSHSSSSGLTGYYVSASNKARFRYKDSSPFTINDINSGSSGSSYNYRAAIHFYTGECQTIASCAAPAAAVDAVDTTSVTISWAPGYDETSWEVWYRIGNTGNFTVASSYVTDLQYTFENLQPGTEYAFMVANICGTDTFFSSVLSVFTDCAPADYVFENFNSYSTGSTDSINQCWYKNKFGTSTNYPYVNSVDGQIALYFYGYTSGSTRYYDWVVGPEMRDSLNTYEIEFDMWKTSTTSYYTSRILVGAMTDPTDINTFDTIADIVDPIYGSWQSQYVSLENYHGDGKYIALLAPDPGIVDPSYSYGYNYCYVDNIYIGKRSSCPKPTRFHARDITATSAVLAWDSIDDYMSVSVKYNTLNDINSAIEATTTDASVMINGLTANTTYFCWITAQCADDNSRTMTCTFTTTAACNPVINLRVTEATSNMASITWASDAVTPASGYIFEWKTSTAATWNSIATNNTYYQLTNLTQGTTYDVRVYAECDNDTAVAATLSFTTTNPGTIGSNEGTYYLPTYPYYEYSISEQMWTANELAEYGDTIHGIYFNSASAITDRDMQIWIVDTTLADLSTTNYVPSTAMTLVMDTVYDIVAGWNYFPFNNDYIRDLNKNLVVLVYDHTGDYESFSGFYATTSATNSLWAYQDGTPYSTTNLSNLTAEGVRAMMRLEATLVQPTCLAPHPVVSGVTDNSVSLAWVPGMNETAWSVDYRGLTDTSWTTVIASTTNTSITVNGLNPSTSYVFRIGALCSDNTMYAAVRGTTACGSFSVPYFEDFNVYSSGEYDFDPCWYKGNTINSNMPYIVNVTNVGPDMLMPQGSYVIFPQMNVPVNQLQIRLQFLSARADIYALVGVCSHPTDILSMTVIDTLWGPNVGEVNWNTVTMDSYTGADGYIAILSNYNQSYIDNIHIEMIPMCGLADSINAENITTTTADINWQNANNAGSYIVEYGPLGGNTFTTVPATSTSLSLSGLQHSTDYLVNIYTVCPTLNDTSIAASYRFTTECDTVTLPYFEDFDHSNAPSLTLTGILPNCWNYEWAPTNTSYMGASYIPQIYSSSSYSHSGNYCLRTYGRTILTLPEMPVDVNQLQISLHDYVTSTGYYNLVIGVCDSNWGNFAQSFVPVDTFLAVNSHTDFTSYKLANYTGSGRFIALTWFYVSGTYSYDYAYHYIDDISIDYLPSCLPVYNLHSTANTSTSVTMDWSVYPGSTASEWELSYSTTPLNDPSTGNVVNVINHPYTINNLSDTTQYYIYVRNICGVGDTSIWMSFGPVHPGEWVMRANQTDTVHMCGGIIYDDGGATGPYSNSQSSTVIIYPSAPGNLIQIQGTFTGEGCCDYLGIYDGVGTSGTQFFYGYCTSSGATMNLGPFQSSNGPITIHFESDGSVSYSGFEFSVSCISTSCMITDFDIDNTVDPVSTALALTWYDNGANSYEIEYGTPGFTLGTGFQMTSTTNHIVITGLSPLTNYEVYVRSLCAGNDTGSWAHRIFQTPMCDNVNEIYSWDSTMSATTSSYAPIGYAFYNYSYVQTLLDSARFAGLTDPISAFAFKPTNTTSSDYYTHMTVWMANVPESSLSAGAITPNDSNHIFIPVLTDASLNFTDTEWQLHGFDTTFTWDGHSNVLIAVKRDHGSYASSGSFSAHSTSTIMTRYYYQDSGPISHISPSASSTGTGSYVGDLKFYSCGLGCSAPNILSTTNLTYQSATVNWSGNATGFEVAVKAASDPTWPAETAVTDNSYDVTGLTPATTYQFRVRSICDIDEGLISDWRVGTFTTDSLPCIAPSDVELVAATVNSATIRWTSNGNENSWRIHVWNTGFDQTYDVTSNPFTVTGLSQTVTYNASVSALCAGIAESDYSDTLVFTTETCQPATDVTVTNVTALTAVVNWNGTANSYNIEYGPLGFGAGDGTTISGITNTTYTITDLEPEMQYDVYVYANCEGQLSGASGVVHFTTTSGIANVDGSNISIYPNPTSSATVVSLTGINGDVTLTIVDMNGRTVLTETMSCEGDCTKRLEVDGLAQGAYFVRISGDSINAVKKLVVK